MGRLCLPNRCDALENFVPVFKRVESHGFLLTAALISQINDDARVEDHKLLVFAQLFDVLDLNFSL